MTSRTSSRIEVNIRRKTNQMNDDTPTFSPSCHPAILHVTHVTNPAKAAVQIPTPIFTSPDPPFVNIPGMPLCVTVGRRARGTPPTPVPRAGGREAGAGSAITRTQGKDLNEGNSMEGRDVLG